MLFTEDLYVHTQEHEKESIFRLSAQIKDLCQRALDVAQAEKVLALLPPLLNIA